MLRCHLFGGFEVTWQEQILRFRTDKARGLLAFLLVERNRQHRREILASLLWPDKDERAALANLSQVLYQLRGAFSKAGAPDPLLTTPQTIGCQPDAALWVDVAIFEQHYAVRTTGNQVERQEAVIQAAALYSGAFLHGLFLHQAPDFEDWCLQRRDQLEQAALEVYAALATIELAAGNFGAAHSLAVRHLAINPWSDVAIRQLIQALSGLGQRAPALAQAETWCTRLQADLGIEPEAETQALITDLRASHRAPAEVKLIPQTPRLHGVPASLTSFVGRTAEIAHLLAELEGPTCRLLTLLGPGGVGKTRLALQVVQQVRQGFPGGIWFIDLSPLDDPTRILVVIAQALHIRPNDQQPLVDHVHSQLVDRDLLLVLDNFEHVLPGARVISQLLRHAPRLKIMVTSRVALQLYGEHEFPVQPLPVPQPREISLQPAALAENPALTLFVDRLRAVQPSFSLSQANAATLAHLCIQLDGLPLALELAAAQGRRWSLDQLQQLGTMLAVIGHGPQDVEPRQQTVRATLAWSYERLSHARQVMLQCAAIFVGGWTAEAVTAVARATLLPEQCPAVCAALLAELEAHNLIQPMSALGPPRWSMLETVRTFMSELIEPALWQALRDHHLAFFTNAAMAAHDDLRRRHAQTPLSKLLAEYENLRYAAKWALTQPPTAQPESLIFITALAWVADYVGFFSEGRALGTALLDHVAPVLPPVSAITPRHRAIHLALALAWGELANNIMGTCDYDQGMRLATDSLHLFAAYDDHLGVARQQNGLGAYANVQGDAAAAGAWFEQSLATHRTGVNYPRGYAQVLANLGTWWWTIKSDARTAEPFLHESLVRFRAIGSTEGIVYALWSYAEVLRSLRRYDQAMIYLDEALALSRTHQHRWALMRALATLARVAADQHHWAQAWEANREALWLSYERGDFLLIAQLCEQIAHLFAVQGDIRMAVQVLAFCAQLRTRYRLPQYPVYAAPLTTLVDHLHQQLAPNMYATATAEGDAWTLDGLVTQLCTMPQVPD